MDQISVPSDWLDGKSNKPSPAPSSKSKAITSRQLRRWTDQTATVIVTLGGLGSIFAIFGIFIYLFVEVGPLFYSSSIEQTHTISTPPLSQESRTSTTVGIDEHMEVGYLIEGDTISFYDIPSGKNIPFASRIPKIDGQIVSLSRVPGKGHLFGLGTAEGHIFPLTISFKVSFQDSIRSISPQLSVDSPLQAIPEGRKLKLFAYSETEEGAVIVALTTDERLWLTRALESKGLFAEEGEPGLETVEIHYDTKNGISAILLDGFGERLVLGTESGRLSYWDIQDPTEVRLIDLTPPSSLNAGISQLAYLIGDRSIIVGTKDGQVKLYMPYRDPDKGGDPKLLHIRDFVSHPASVTAISPSQRDKGFMTGDAAGTVYLHHSTSGQTLAQFSSADGNPLLALMFSPKANGAITVDATGRVAVYDIDNEHPETTVQSLFTPVVYEGYSEPEHIWQSSSGSDDFEPKFGLWPLIFGTLKGTFYAMLLATPLAVLGAIYTGMFMTPNLRSVVKPVVEIMEALPTVVLGFLAGLWFAPLLEEVFPGIAAIFIVLPIVIVLLAVIWQFVPPWLSRSSGGWTELVGIMVTIIVTVWLCLHFNDLIEHIVFGGNYKEFLLETYGLGYDQRNALVIAFAMGMAVIPTIFSISEDAISNVPRHLIAGSLAMGATPWQTLARLVLVSASPGLFSALMIGLGRVVGETMIVLMATGNTPLMDMNLFNGFRTLSANIAVEMPEAPHGGTLYRLLFLSALLLFAFTTLVNTIAEIVRQKLRARYSQY